MGKKQIDKTLKIFVDRAKKQFRAKQVILFGSYARGEANEYSDVDCIIVADSFRTMPETKRLDAIYPIIRDLDPDFHVFGYTPDELLKVDPLSTLAEIKKTGVTLL